METALIVILSLLSLNGIYKGSKNGSLVGKPVLSSSDCEPYNVGRIECGKKAGGNPK